MQDYFNIKHVVFPNVFRSYHQWMPLASLINRQAENLRLILLLR